MSATKALPLSGLLADPTRDPSPSEVEEAVLVRRASAGNRAAFAELVRRHQGRIRGLMLRLCADRVVADDLAQEAFMRAYRAMVGFEARSKFGTWLYRIAYNVFLNQKARGKVFARLPQDYEATAQAPDGELSPRQSDLRRDLEQAIAKLPEKYRLVVVLHYLHDVRYPELAEILEMPIGTVKTHLHRAKRELREHMHSWEPPR